MPLLPYALTRPFLFGLDPEAAHDLTMGSLQRLQNTPAQCLWQQPRVQDPVQLLGLRWPNRVADDRSEVGAGRHVSRRRLDQGGTRRRRYLHAE